VLDKVSLSYLCRLARRKSLGLLFSRLLLPAQAEDALEAGTVSVLQELLRRFDTRIAIAALAGALAWFAPHMMGGGDIITLKALVGGIGLAALPLIFAVRFVLGPLSYAAGTPGGLFAPILALGACIGLGFGLLCPRFVADSGATYITFAIAGMAAFLTATVRAPVTGMILIFEMTGAFNQALPMLWACFAAMAVPTLTGNSPL